MTTHRTRVFSEISEAAVRKVGIPVIDWGAVTQSRWDASYDGLHYASNMGGEDNVVGQVTMSEYQVALNVIFPTCTGDPNKVDKESGDDDDNKQ